MPSSPVTETLKRCPFCGAPALMTHFERDTTRITQIQCGNDEDCPVCVDVQQTDEAVAVKVWNARTSDLAQTPADTYRETVRKVAAAREKRMAQLRDCLQSIADMPTDEPREPDDADWRFRCLSAVEAARNTLADTSTLCPTCNGRKIVGGFVNATSGYQDDPCPDCSVSSPVENR